MKIITKTTVQFICLIMFIMSCDFNDNLIEYDEKLVVFASINAGFPVNLYKTCGCIACKDLL